MKPSYSTLWARNILMWSDLTLGFSYKVKQWLIALVSCLFGGYNLHRFSNALGLVL